MARTVVVLVILLAGCIGLVALVGWMIGWVCHGGLCP